MIRTSFRILSRHWACRTISSFYETRQVPLWNGALAVSRNSSAYTPSRVGLVTPVFLQASRHLDRVAVVDRFGSHRYEDILFHANVLTDKILNSFDVKSGDMDGERICLLCPNDVSYVVGQWATWMSGGVTVPLSPKHPLAQLQYFVEDSQSKLVIATEELAHQVEPLVSRLGVKMLTMGKSSYWSTTDESDEDADESAVVNADDNEVVNREQRWSMRFNRLNQLRDANRFKRKPAIIVYTSGTTGHPKVHTSFTLMQFCFPTVTFQVMVFLTL